MAEHDEIRRHLLIRLENLTGRADRIRSDRRHESEPLERDFEEQAVQLENDEVLDALDDSGRRELEAIRDALQRIDAGQYGTCGSCGEQIPDARLRVHPTALYCVECAAAAER
jgi:DnaK suppressor protein